MAAGATSPDLKALADAIQRLPAAVTIALRTVAKGSAERIRRRAHDAAPVGAEPRGTHTAGNPHLRDSIVIVEDVTRKQFSVFPETPWLPNLGLWIERGTTHMQARPFMRPAGDSEDAQYKAESMKAAEHVVTEALK